MNTSNIYEILQIECGGQVQLSKREFEFLKYYSVEEQKKHLEVEVSFSENTYDDITHVNYNKKTFHKVYSFEEFLKKYHTAIDRLMIVGGVIVGLWYNIRLHEGETLRSFIGNDHIVDIERNVMGTRVTTRYYYAKVMFIK